MFTAHKSKEDEHPKLPCLSKPRDNHDEWNDEVVLNLHSKGPRMQEDGRVEHLKTI